MKTIIGIFVIVSVIFSALVVSFLVYASYRRDLKQKIKMQSNAQ